MKLSFSILTATHTLLEATFDDDGEMLPVITYDNRRVKLSPWKAEIVENAVRGKHDIDRSFADARYERNERRYA